MRLSLLAALLAIAFGAMLPAQPAANRRSSWRTAARPRTHPSQPFIPGKEIDRLIWLPPPEAVSRMDHAQEQELVRAALGIPHT